MRGPLRQHGRLATALTEPGEARRDRADVTVIKKFINFAALHGSQTACDLKRFAVFLPREQKDARPDVCIQKHRFGIRIALQFELLSGIALENEVCARAGEL